MKTMKNIPTFEEFLSESLITRLNEDEQENVLDFAVRHGLGKAMRFKSSNGYKDGQNHEPLFSLFHYESGFPQAGLRKSYFKDDVPAEKFKAVIKSANDYLKTGVASEPILEFVAFLYKDASPGGRSQGSFEEGLERIRPDFNKENKDLPIIKDTLKYIIEVLKSWTSGTVAARLNLAVAVYAETSYSAYSGSDFTKVYGMIVSSLRKNKVKLAPNSEIKINKDNTYIDSRTISNSIGFAQVEINEWESTVTYTVDGKEYIAGSFTNSAGYGRY
jgi:hypothetical protein